MAVFTSVIYRDSESPSESVEVGYELWDMGVMMQADETVIPVVTSIKVTETGEIVAWDNLDVTTRGTLIHEAWEHYHAECERARELWRGSWDGMRTLTI